MCSSSEAGSYLGPIDSCITQLEDHGNPRTCTESREHEEEEEESASPLAPLARVCVPGLGLRVSVVGFKVCGLVFRV